MSDLEQRLRRAFKILFDDRDRMQKEIEQRLGDLYRIGKN